MDLEITLRMDNWRGGDWDETQNGAHVMRRRGCAMQNKGITLNKITRATVVITITMYLLTEWEGRTGKYLARGHGVRTERHDRGPNIFPSGPT